MNHARARGNRWEKSSSPITPSIRWMSNRRSSRPPASDLTPSVQNSGAARPAVGDADAVITQFAPVDAQVIAAMKRARAIVRYGIGVDNVDLDAARKHGIPVCNVPDYCIDEVADHTLAFILAVRGRLSPIRCTCVAANGAWRRPYPPSARSRTWASAWSVLAGSAGTWFAGCWRFAGGACFDPAVKAADIESSGRAAVVHSTNCCRVRHSHAPLSATARRGG